MDWKRIRHVACNTRPMRGVDPYRTNLTIDLGLLTIEDIVDYAIDSIVIKAQNIWRRNYINYSTPIPATYTYIVPKPGTRSAAQSPEELLFTMFGHEVASNLITKHGSASAALAFVKDIIGGGNADDVDDVDNVDEVDETDEIE